MDYKEFLKASLRGIIDIDGCLYPKNKAHTYPTISIISTIPNLQKSITKSCNTLGLKLSNWRDKNIGVKVAYIRTKGDTFKFFKEINFNNPKHLARWERFNKAPVV